MIEINRYNTIERESCLHVVVDETNRMELNHEKILSSQDVVVSIVCHMIAEYKIEIASSLLYVHII